MWLSDLRCQNGMAPARGPPVCFIRICRIEGVVVAHIYPCIGILTHDLLALQEPAVEYFLSFGIGNQIAEAVRAQTGLIVWDIAPEDRHSLPCWPSRPAAPTGP